jgi:hypothetical protein
MKPFLTYGKGCVSLVLLMCHYHHDISHLSSVPGMVFVMTLQYSTCFSVLLSFENCLSPSSQNEVFSVYSNQRNCFLKFPMVLIFCPMRIEWISSALVLDRPGFKFQIFYWIAMQVWVNWLIFLSLHFFSHKSKLFTGLG